MNENSLLELNKLAPNPSAAITHNTILMSAVGLQDSRQNLLRMDLAAQLNTNGAFDIVGGAHAMCEVHSTRNFVAVALVGDGPVYRLRIMLVRGRCEVFIGVPELRGSSGVVQKPIVGSGRLANTLVESRLDLSAVRFNDAKHQRLWLAAHVENVTA